MNMNKGDIFKLRKEFKYIYEKDCYKHPFIYWTGENADYRGIMLTTSEEPKYNNIKLLEEHFKKGFKTIYGKSTQKQNSLIAPFYLLKDIRYEHLEKTGELTDTGILFISGIIDLLDYTDWKTYMKMK